MSTQLAVSPRKQLPMKHSPKSTEKTKASPNKKVVMSELFGHQATSISKKQKVNQDGDNGKHTPKNGSKSQQTSDKNGSKKAQAPQKAATNQKQQAQNQNQGTNHCSNGAATQSKQKSCFNQFCALKKSISSGSSPQKESTRKQGGNGGYKQLKLDKTGEKVAFCELCSSRYQEKHFCYYCQQVYFDEYNIDEKDWIQCDSCDRWCHLNCEDEKIKKAFNNLSSENVQYDCPRCRTKEVVTPSTSATSTTAGNTTTTTTTTSNTTVTKQTQNNTKAPKEKATQNQSVGSTKLKKQGKIKEKDDKKQEQAEAHVEASNGQANAQLLQTQTSHSQYHYSVQSARMDSVVQSSIKKGTAGHNSINRDSITQNNSNDQDIFYSFDNFLKKKNKAHSNQTQQIQHYHPIQQIQLLPNYTTIEDLLKSAGISVSLDETSIKSDLSYLKRIILESSDPQFQSNQSNGTLNCGLNKNQYQNGIINHIQNGQNYSIIVNQE